MSRNMFIDYYTGKISYKTKKIHKKDEIKKSLSIQVVAFSVIWTDSAHQFVHVGAHFRLQNNDINKS